MPRPNDSPDVAASKTLAYILRHGAEKEGLHMRSDGLIRLADVLARPKMKAVDEPTVFRLVNENAKKRFELVYGMDPSPPKPKKVKGPKKKAPQRPPPGSDGVVDALGDKLAATAVTVTEAVPAPPTTPAEPEWKELEFVVLTPPEDGTPGEGQWYIRASQGHTLKVETTHLEPVTDTPEGRARAGLMVHGTQWKLWPLLKENGLSRMQRQHVHLAPALRNHRITPRPNSTLLIFLSLQALLAASIPVFTSANGVVLTPGDATGVVRKEFWRKAVHLDHGRRIVVWENGKETERDEVEGEEGE